MLDPCNELCSSGLPASCTSCVVKLLMLDIRRKLFDQIFFLPAMLIVTIVFYDVIPLTDLDFGWGPHSQHRAKPFGSIFSHVQLIRVKFDLLQKQFRLKILILLLSEI